VLVPAVSVDGPQAVLYAAHSDVVNSTAMQADAPLLSGSAYSSSSSSDPSAWVPIPQALDVHVLAPPQPLGLGPVQDPPGILQPPAGVMNGMVQAPQALGVLSWSQPLGTGPMLDLPGVLQQPAVAVDTTAMQADAPLRGGSAYSSSSADPTACASTPQVSSYAYEEPLGERQCAGGCARVHVQHAGLPHTCFLHAACACSTCSLCGYTPYLSLPAQGMGGAFLTFAVLYVVQF
jgi:hypothetical protein